LNTNEFNVNYLQDVFFDVEEPKLPHTIGSARLARTDSIPTWRFSRVKIETNDMFTAVTTTATDIKTEEAVDTV
jgi:hypothetical protein